MASIVIETADLVYRSTDVISVRVFDDNGDPVDLGQVGAKIGITVARNNDHRTPALLMKRKGEAGEGVSIHDTNQARFTFTPADYVDGNQRPQMYPRSFGYWQTVWYQGEGDTERAVATGPLTVQATAPIEWGV